MPNTDETIRCEVKVYRKRKGLSQDELAQLIGVRRQAVYDMESGRYLPNTAVALRLARVLGCTVEMLFTENTPICCEDMHLLHGAGTDTRLSLVQVRERLVGIPLNSAGALSFNLDAADGFLLPDKTIECHLPRGQLAKAVLILGCDPALSVLSGLLARVAPGIRAHATFASSRRALLAVRNGSAHIAGMHYHSAGADGGNIAAVRALSPNMNCRITTFSMQEEGFMVAPGNPLCIRTVEDIANGKTRFVNREEGAALRKLLDAHLALQAIPNSEILGYTEEVYSHNEGAICVARDTADAALGLRIVAKAFGLDFVPLDVSRCDLVIPSDLCDHIGITILLDILQSACIRKELSLLPGYDTADTGKIIC